MTDTPDPHKAPEGDPSPPADAAAAAAPNTTPESTLLYGIDDIPPLPETIALGFQHYLTMFGSTVAIPLIISPWLGITEGKDKAVLIATMFFISGVTTLLQTTFGNRLPIVQGGTFSFLGPTFTICTLATVAEASDWQIRMQHVQGAVISGAIVEIALGATGVVGRMLRFIGPITIAPTIALIGLSLFKFGAPEAGRDWWIGGLTIGLIILFSQVLRKTHRAFELFPILLAIVVAWGVAALLTATGVFAEGHPSYVDTTTLQQTPWIRIPMPFPWGMPEFGMAAFVGMLAGYMASIVESIGDYYACARLAGAPPPDKKLVNRGVMFEGIGCLIAGIWGTGNGTTSYSENVGAIGLTRVGSRRVVQAGAALMLVLGFVAKFGGLFTTIPQPIVGGMYCALFGMIAAVGLSNLQRVDLNSSRNLFVLGFAFFMGLSLPVYFEANPIDFSPATTAEPTALSDEDVVHSDGAALAALGLAPDATVAQAKAVHTKLSAVFESGATGTNPQQVTELDAALEVLSLRPAPKPEPSSFWKALENLLNTIGKTGMAVGALIALILDNVIPGTPEERGLAVAHT